MEERQRIVDIRWQTNNTKLASALLCKGFTLSTQPFLTKVAPNGQRTTTIYFNSGIRIDGEIVLCEAVETLWQEIATEQCEPEKMPELYWMRSALESRDELILTYIHPRRPFVPSPGHLLTSDLLRTDDLVLASSIRSCGHAVRGYRDRYFYFPPEAKADALHYDSKADPEHPMQWRRVVLLQQYNLVGAIKSHQAANIRNIQGPGKRSAILPTNMPEDLTRQMLRELYRDH